MIFNYIYLFFIFLILLVLFVEMNSLNINYWLLLLFFLVIILIILNWSVINLNFVNKTLFKNNLSFLLCIIFTILMVGFWKEDSLDIYFLNFLVFFGSLIIVNTNQLFLVYLAIELQTFPIFVLICKEKFEIKASEAALKYFILGALSSGFFLLGCSMLYLNGLTLDLRIFQLSQHMNSFVEVSCLFIIISLIFKLALFPFHFWIADIYEGSSLKTITTIAILPKISIIYVFMQVLNYNDFITLVGLISVVVANISALNQSKIKRLLAYSGISHFGFIILMINFFNVESLQVGFFYLMIYTSIIVGMFLLMKETFFTKDYYLIELSGLNNLTIILGLSWVVLFLSISGIPPLSGFISKWFFFSNLVSENYIFLTVLLILASVIGVGYYLRIVKIMIFQSKNDYFNWSYILSKKSKDSTLNYVIIGWIIYLNIFLILNPNSFFIPIYYFLNYIY
uniref:NADH:ubiquinone reductase (H(+)-translocating) n=1 Tax=Turritopsis dohrnii TaxID=308579 RepID=A0A1I9KRD8_9CNID|nr:NADH dehydrogenase subunit 2 [Turritopsis dohrnii]